MIPKTGIPTAIVMWLNVLRSPIGSALMEKGKTMDDLISRRAAIDAMYMGCYLTPKDRSDLVKALEQLPTIDAVLVKPGEWIHGREVSRNYVGDACVCIHYEKWWCSECNYTVDWGEPVWHYCPNCGAKMDGERRT